MEDGDGPWYWAIATSAKPILANLALAKPTLANAQFG